MNEITREFTHILRALLEQEPLFIQIVLGPRQVGKTTGVQQILRAWSGGSIYVSADNEIAPGPEWLRAHWVAVRLLPDPALLVVDEIQDVADWSRTVKGLWDEDRLQGRALRVVILGSSSLALQYGFTESLAGRFELNRVAHWSLAEMQETFEFSLDAYLEFGGYPAPSQLLPNLQRWENYMRHSIIDPVIEQDILARRRINKPALFRQLFELVMEYPAQVISYQKLLGQLQDKGNADTIKDYCLLLEQSYLVISLQKFSTRPVSRRTSSPKLVPLANSLIRAVTRRNIDDPAWRGRLFEASLIAHFSNSGFPLYYWSEGQAEIDVVVIVNNNPLALEIKSSRKRVSSGLKAFRQKFPNIKALLLTPDLGEQLLKRADIRTALEELYANTSDM